MGFFSKLFKSREIQKERSLVRISEADTWLGSWIDNRFENVREKIEEFYEDKKKEIEKLEENLKALDSAKLRNEKIPSREIQLMEGNRVAFIKKHRIFIDNIIFPENLRIHNFSPSLKAFFNNSSCFSIAFFSSIPEQKSSSL